MIETQVPETIPPIASYCVPGPRLILIVALVTHASKVIGFGVWVGVGRRVFVAGIVGVGVLAGTHAQSKATRIVKQSSSLISL